MKTCAAILTMLATSSAPLAIAFADDTPLGFPSGGERAHRLHLRLDTAATYAIGGQSALGVQARVDGYTALWNTALGTGAFDLGLQLAYGNEPVWLAPWLSTSQVQGATHRAQEVVTVGHSVHFGVERRAAIGLHLYAGLNHWISSYTVTYAGEGVMGSDTESRTVFLAGGEVDFAYRFSRYVGLYVMANVPFPTTSSYVITIFSVGLGLSFYLH